MLLFLILTSDLSSGDPVLSEDPQAPSQQLLDSSTDHLFSVCLSFVSPLLEKILRERTLNVIIMLSQHQAQHMAALHKY